ncbi:MAG: sarcosine oxidase subunit gamma [Novosphingobium sp.]
MADAALRTTPVPAGPAKFNGVTIALGAQLARFSLRARDTKALAKLIGRKLPAKIGSSEGDVCMLGPDEWLLRVPEGTMVPDGAGLPLAVVDIGERAVTLAIEGSRAEAVLQTGCPRDLSTFAVGEARRTVFEGIEMILLRTGSERFEVDVWRSFAPHLHLALTTAASHG